MGSGGVPYLINGLHSRVDRGVKADGIFGAGDIQVNGSRHADGVDSQVRQLLRSGKGTVSSDDYQTVDAEFTAGSRRLLQTFLGAHLRAASCIQNGAAPLDGIGHILGGQINDFLIHQAIVAFEDSLHLDSSAESPAHRRTDRGIHTGSVAAAGQDADCLYFALHSHLFSSILTCNPHGDSKTIRRPGRYYHSYFNAFFRVFQCSFLQLSRWLPRTFQQVFRSERRPR